MKNVIRSVRPVLSFLSRLALYLAAAGIIGMTLIVGWQVFGRYVLNDTPSWSEPLSLFLMSWFILLGAAVGVRESSHLGLDIVRYAMPKPVQRAMDIISLVCVSAFGGFMSYYGVLLAKGTWTATIPVLGWPGGVDFIPLIVGGSMIALFAFERLCDVILQEPEAPAQANVAEII
jgi:TRAP-type C4-dicarboxylate transport system permease small subunit